MCNLADGRISDAFGRQSALLFAAAFFFIGSFLCGAADGLWSLVAARIIAGIGGGGLNTVSESFCISKSVASDVVSLYTHLLCIIHIDELGYYKRPGSIT